MAADNRYLPKERIQLCIRSFGMCVDIRIGKKALKTAVGAREGDAQ